MAACSSLNGHKVCRISSLHCLALDKSLEFWMRLSQLVLSLVELEGVSFHKQMAFSGVILLAKGPLRRSKLVSLFRPPLRKSQTSAILHDGAQNWSIKDQILE